MKQRINKKTLGYMAKNARAQAQARHEQFMKAVLSKGLLETIAWADSDLDVLARGEVADAVLRELERGATASAILSLATQRALEMGEFPSRSTSAMANRVHASRAAAWAATARGAL